MRGTVAGLASEIPETISPEGYAKGFEEGLREGLWEASTEAPLIAVPNFLKHNKPESPNVVRSWAAIVDTLPECSLRDIHFQRVKAFAEGLGKGFREALPEAFREPLPKGMPNPEPEPEQEPEQEHKQERHAAPPNAPAAPPAENRVCASGLKARFEQFWAEYPSKKAKPKAWEVWEELAPDDALLAVMLEAIALQKTCNQWRRGVIPNPDTWLRERRWEDQPAESPGPGREGKPAPPADPPRGFKRPAVHLPSQPPPKIPEAARERAGEWEVVRERLAATVDTESFDTWIEPARCLGRTDREIWLEAPSVFIRNWLANNFDEAIVQASGARRVHFLVAEIAEEVEA
jgi:hypothetical protein